MIAFLFKGLLRDRSRSLFPVVITAAGVAITILVVAWMGGVVTDTIETSARFKTGHLKVQSKAMWEQQFPNVIELAMDNEADLIRNLDKDYPALIWKPRIGFGGLLDIPDEKGETAAQAPVIGLAADIMGKDSLERDNLNLAKSLVSGSLPTRPGDILVSNDFFKKLGLELGQKATLITSDMNGSLAFYNFHIAGTVTFGIRAMDRGAIIADLKDIQEALNMIDASTEIFGFFKQGTYQPEKADQIKNEFNRAYTNSQDNFKPVMVTLEDQDDLGMLLRYMDSVISVIILVFVFIVSIVLWNAGLMNGIRRYGEIGVRLAIGESKKHLYFSLVLEAILVGFVGYLIGTAAGLIPAYYLQEHGVNISSMMANSSMMMSNVMRAKITPIIFWIGIIPGVVAPIIGALISGLGIFKRETAHLFKELEA